MNIRAISDEKWNELYCKPFVFLGFHKYDVKLIAVAIFDDSLCECRIIEDSHESKQQFFAEIHKKYVNSPVALFSKKTERYLKEFLEERQKINSFFAINLKGPKKFLNRWTKEIEQAIKFSDEKVSADNPIQVF